MKKYVKGILALLIVASLTACGGKESAEAPAATATEPEEKVNPITANKTGIFELEGEISNINTISNTFVLKTGEGDVEIQVRAMSRLMLSGERTSLSAVKSGSHAKGKFKKWSGQDAAMEVVITP
ncbi:MAG: hypothetical protein IMF07_03255 [Proteobacteria bacterium]|nr:hypothetical protein [Pseudomonadota bacterium]